MSIHPWFDSALGALGRQVGISKKVARRNAASSAKSRAHAVRRLFAEQLEERRVLTGIPPTITLPGGGGGTGWSLDSTFGASGLVTTPVNSNQNELVNALAIQADGKIVAVGVSNDGSTDDFVVARYLPDGTLDSTFGIGGIVTIEFPDDDASPGALDLANEMAMAVAIVDGTGQIVVGGQYDFSQLAIAWIDPADGSVQQKFRSALPDGTGAQLEGLAIDGNDHVVAVGPTANNSDWFVARITPAGEFDPSFANDDDGVLVDLGSSFEGASDVFIEPTNGKIIVGGWTVGVTSSSYAVVQLNTDGTVDTTGFGVDGIALAQINGDAQGIVRLSDGSIALAGFALNENLEVDLGLAKFDANGVLDFALTTDLAGGDDFGFDLAVQNDKLVVVGSTISSGSSDPDFVVVSYNSDGSLDESFAEGGYLQADFGGTSDRAFAVAVQEDGKLVLGGQGGDADLALARFATSSGDPETFDLDEGESFTLTGSYTDADGTLLPTIVIDWGDGKPATQAILDPDTLTFSAIYTYGDNSPPAIPFAIIATITDDQGNFATAETTATVANVDPVAGPIDGPSGGVRNQALSFAGAFSDAGIDDTHEVRWDFGDGSFIDFTPSTAPGALQPQHVYATAGEFTVTLTVRDDDGGEHAISTTVEIDIAQLQTAPCGCGDALFVGGTSASDNIVLSKVGGGLIQVTIDNVVVGTFAPTHGIVVYAGGGNDDVTVAAAITQSAWLYGGDGDDRLKGGSGPNVLLGGEGDDLLVGGSNRDILVGGRGADRIIGNGQDDLLIAGFTNHDDNAEALCHVLAEWTSNKLYYVRVLNLTGLLPVVDPQNGSYFLNTHTVHDDGVQDLLTGSSGFDWFFANLCLDDDSLVKDKIIDKSILEIALDIDFING